VRREGRGSKAGQVFFILFGRRRGGPDKRAQVTQRKGRIILGRLSLTRMKGEEEKRRCSSPDHLIQTITRGGASCLGRVGKH